MQGERFEQLYASHAQALFGFLYFRTRDAALTEDLLAETFERALRSRGRFDRRKGSQKTWLYAIALNCLRDHARRRSAEQRALARLGAGNGAPVSPLDHLETRDELEHALATLSSEERETLGLRFGADLTVPEIARVTGEKRTTIDGRLYRGLRRLREELAD